MILFSGEFPALVDFLKKPQITEHDTLDRRLLLLFDYPWTV